jgi:hypothetical protein
MLLVISLVGAAFFRRRRGGRAEQVDLYYGNGSLLSLTAGAGGDELLTLAREILREARA